MSIVTDRPRDCLSCRLVGGFGLVGIGTYLGVISRKNKPLNTQAAKTTVAIIACGNYLNIFLSLILQKNILIIAYNKIR